MAHPSQDPTVESLIRRSQAARDRISLDLARLRYKADVPARVKDSLRSNPLGWLGGSLATGLLASFALHKGKPKPEKKVRRGLTGLALTAAGALLKPMVKTWLTGRLHQSLASRQNTYSHER